MEVLKRNWIKILIGFTAGVLVLFLGLCVAFKWYLYMPFFYKTLDKDSYDKTVEMLNEKLPTQIFVYGEELDFRKTVQFKQIDTISADAMKNSKEYTILIVSDWNGNVTLTKEDVACIKEQTKNLNFYFYYIGNAKLDMLVKEGIFTVNAFGEKDRCTGIVTHEGNRMEWGGIFTTEDYKIVTEHHLKGELEAALLDNVDMCYRSNN